MKLAVCIGKLFFCVIIVYFLTRLTITNNLKWAEQATSYVIYPFVKVSELVSYPFVYVGSYVSVQSHLLHEYAALQSRYQDLQSQLSNLQARYDYVLDIENLHAARLRYKTDTAHLANIMIKQIVPKSDHFIMVDKGSKDGIEVDMVAVYKNCLIGRVSHVYPWYSKITLITDRSCKISSYCPATYTEGIHEGVSESERTKLNFVSHLDTVNNGDMVLSSGKGLVFPRGFMLGTIVSSSAGPLQYDIDVVPAIAIDTINVCYLINKSDIR